MKPIIFVIETLRENCRWLDDGKCRHTNEQPYPECKSARYSEHVATSYLLANFVSRCPLMNEGD
jgi:hypothetical protein